MMIKGAWIDPESVAAITTQYRLTTVHLKNSITEVTVPEMNAREVALALGLPVHSDGGPDEESLEFGTDRRNEDCPRQQARCQRLHTHQCRLYMDHQGACHPDLHPCAGPCDLRASDGNRCRLETGHEGPCISTAFGEAGF